MRFLIAAAMVGVIAATHQTVAAAPTFTKGFINPQLTVSWDRWTIGGADSFITEGEIKSKRGGEVFTFTNPIRFDTGDPNTILRFSLRLIWERVTSRQVQYQPEGQGGRTTSAKETSKWNMAGGSEGEVGFRYGRLIVFAAAGGEINERTWDIFYTLRPGWEITRGLCGSSPPSTSCAGARMATTLP